MNIKTVFYLFLLLTSVIPMPILVMENKPQPKKLEDLEKLQEIEQQFIFTYCDGGCPAGNINREAFPYSDNDPKYKQISVHTNQGDHVGLIDFGSSSKHKNELFDCHVSRVDVHPAYRKKGIGKVLLHKAFNKMAQENNCTCLSLHSAWGVFGFYEKLGMKNQNTIAEEYFNYDYAKNGPIIKAIEKLKPVEKIKKVHKAHHYLPE